MRLIIVSFTLLFFSSYCLSDEGKEVLIEESAERQTVTPLVFIPGAGPLWITSGKQLAGYFLGDGFPAGHIHQIHYPWRKNLKSIEMAFLTEVKRLFQHYPAQTKFRFISHSMGQFVGLYTLIKHGYGHKIEQFISLAGVFWGQEKTPAFCSFSHCSDLYRILVPYKSNFISEFYQRHGDAFKALKTCSLFSESDKRVNNPVDASSFDLGKNIHLKTVGHLEFIKSKKVYRIIVNECL